MRTTPFLILNHRLGAARLTPIPLSGHHGIYHRSSPDTPCNVPLSRRGCEVNRHTPRELVLILHRRPTFSTPTCRTASTRLSCYGSVHLIYYRHDEMPPSGDFILPETLVQAGRSSVPLSPAVPGSTRVSARIKPPMGRDSSVNITAGYSISKHVTTSHNEYKTR